MNKPLGVLVAIVVVAVAWGVLNAGKRPPRSRFIKIPLDLRDANGLAALSMSCYDIYVCCCEPGCAKATPWRDWEGMSSASCWKTARSIWQKK